MALAWRAATQWSGLQTPTQRPALIGTRQRPGLNPSASSALAQIPFGDGGGYASIGPDILAHHAMLTHLLSSYPLLPLR